MKFNNSFTQAINAYIASGRATECFNLCNMARALNVGNQRVYSASRIPIPGEEYNPKEFNWDALERFVLRRLDHGESMDDFVARVYGIQEEMKSVDKRNSRDKRVHILKDDGTEVTYPGRRGPAVVPGMTLKLHNDPTEYTVEAASSTHVVLSNPATPELTMLSNWGYNSKVDRSSVIPPAPVEIQEPVTGVTVEQ